MSVAPPPFAAGVASGGSRPQLVASIGAAPTSSTTTRSPVVTLQPTGGSGRIPGDASDGSDFYGLGAAVLAIALIVVLAKLVFRNRRPEQQDREG